MENQLNQVEQLDEKMADEIMKDLLYKRAYFEAGLVWAKYETMKAVMMNFDDCYGLNYRASLHSFCDTGFKSFDIMHYNSDGIPTTVDDYLNSKQNCEDYSGIDNMKEIFHYLLAVPLVAYLSQWKFESKKQEKPLFLYLNDPYFSSSRVFYNNFSLHTLFSGDYKSYLMGHANQWMDIVDENWVSIDSLAKSLLIKQDLDKRQINNIIFNSKFHYDDFHNFGDAEIEINNEECFKNLLVLCKKGCYPE